LASAATALPGCAPAQVEDSELVARIASMARAEVSSDTTASVAIGVMRGAEVILAEGYGHADIENDVHATAETVYRIGSITKQFTSTAIMQLVERGDIDPDDEITEFLPDYATQGHRITIHHLLTHTSGIKSYTGLGREHRNRTFRVDLTHDELIDMFEDEPFDFGPGEQWRYNNSGYYLLGVIIERVTGQSYADYLDEHIYGPLEMNASSYCGEKKIIPNRAEGYERSDGRLVNDDPLSMNIPGAAGALCSSVTDLLKWQTAMNANSLISQQSYDLMTTPARLNNDSVTTYGYGLAVRETNGHRRIAHGGGINGFVTMLAYYPDDDLTVVVLSNTPGAHPGTMEQQIAEWALEND
jgi:CubicO group peptidase (beta-lactamase class C family)